MDAASMFPLLCLIAGVVSVLFLILFLRVHAFVALIVSALLVAFISDRIGATEAIPFVTLQFGNTMAGIGVLLVLASMIGKCIMDSGAADRIVRAFTRVLGPGREKYALLLSGFVLSIPVFFDTVYYLLAPLGRSVYSRTKKDYALIIACVAGGAAITHALVPPTPGPILVVEAFNDAAIQLNPNGGEPIVSLLMTIWVGIICAFIPMIVGIIYASIVNRFMQVTPSEVIGITDQQIEAMAAKPDSELPSLWFSMVPFLLPVFLLAALSFLDMYVLEVAKPLIKENNLGSARALLSDEYFPLFKNEAGSILAYVYLTFSIIGDKNIAFFMGTAIAVYLVILTLKATYQSTFERLEPAISSGAVIAFITCGGGAFGKTLAEAGIGDLISQWSETWGIPLIVIAYGTATLIRIAQGSATAAMIITAGIVAPVIVQSDLPYHPVYLISIIGFGATGFSWMNDSGFWIFCRMSGITVRQTLIIWTGMLTVISVSGFGWVYLLTQILPLV